MDIERMWLRIWMITNTRHNNKSLLDHHVTQSPQHTQADSHIH